MVDSPVPVTALTQTNRASIYAILNLPLDAVNIAASTMGQMILGVAESAEMDGNSVE